MDILRGKTFVRPRTFEGKPVVLLCGIFHPKSLDDFYKNNLKISPEDFMENMHNCQHHANWSIKEI